MIDRQLRKSIQSLPEEFITQELPSDEFEAIFSFSHEKSGLQAIIALHSLELGPAIGGVRIFPYASEEEALVDVKRLSKAMTYKAAVAGVGIGGGKSVIIADPKTVRRETLEAFGTVVQAFSGHYFAAKDVGVSGKELAHINTGTQYVVGLPNRGSGDPSAFTAWGVFSGIRASLERAFGSPSLEGVRVAVQGLGAVGFALAKYLFWEGAELLVSDLDPMKTALCAKKFSAKVVATDEILRSDCDVLAPCALGGVISAKNIPSIQARIIAGGANNVLDQESDAELLHQRKILYAPDYVINAAGLFHVLLELEEGGYSAKASRNHATNIRKTLSTIYQIAKETNTSTAAAAKSLADYRLQYKIGKRTVPLQVPE
ncbi:MAG: Glu/Leu/Phe/Val dehydrogenase dimerization domain-containing protein [Chlamydiota bacterium]